MKITPLYSPIFYCILIFVLFSCEENKTINWSPTFDSNDKIPFGTYVFRNELGSLFNKSKNVDIYNNPSIFLDNDTLYDPINYIHIKDYILHSNDTKLVLKNLVYSGNVAFIASENPIEILETYPHRKEDDLIPIKEKLETDSSDVAVNNNLDSSSIDIKNLLKIGHLPIDYKNTKDRALATTKINFTLTSAIFSKKEYTIEGISSGFYFKDLKENDTIKILGHLIYDKKAYPNFIEIKYGEGAYLLHLEPYIYTNYAMLKDNYSDYAVACISHLDDNEIWWDNKNIMRRYLNNSQEGGLVDFLNFAWKQKGLKYAISLIIITFILLILFNYKRKQSAIKYVKNYENKNLDFAQNMAQLYKTTNNIHLLAKIKINYFLEQVRQFYHIDTQNLNDLFAQQLSKKSLVNYEECLELIQTIQNMISREECSHHDFVQLSLKIENFNKKSHIHGRK